MDRAGVAKNKAIRAMLQQSPCNVLCLQEINLNEHSAVSYVNEWQKTRFSALVGNLDEDTRMYRVGIVSQVPIKPLQLANIDQPGEHCTGILARGSSVDKVVVRCTYGNAGDPQLAASHTHTHTPVGGCLAQRCRQVDALGRF